MRKMRDEYKFGYLHKNSQNNCQQSEENPLFGHKTSGVGEMKEHRTLMENIAIYLWVKGIHSNYCIEFAREIAEMVVQFNQAEMYFVKHEEDLVPTAEEAIKKILSEIVKKEGTDYFDSQLTS